MPRFFVTPNDIDKETGVAALLGDDAHHIARSLRMAVGDKVTLADGEGKEYLARLTLIRDDRCELQIESEAEAKTEPPVDITLFMSYPKGDKLETIIQKSVELGCICTVPFISERCIKRPKEEKSDKQTARLTKIAHEAAKQCGRGVLPTVLSPITFEELLIRIKDYDLTLFCYEGEGTRSLKDVLPTAGAKKSIAVIVGSEGGFAKAEAEKITACGAVAVGLGPRILRCETAPIACLAVISYELEM